MTTPSPAGVENTVEDPPARRDPDADAAAFVAALEQGHDGLASYYAAQADAADQVRDEHLAQPAAMVAAALYYVHQGLRVFPLTPGAKVPLPSGRDGSAAALCCGGSHRRGCKDALADTGAVYAWWRQHPDANLGVATGHLVDVWDQDGPDGALSWARHASEADRAAVLAVCTTARGLGGVHRYVRATGRGNTAAILPGLDYRGAGGYVVAPPSVVNGRRYAWAQPLQLGRAA